MRRILKTKLRQLTGNLLLTLFITGFGMSSCTYYTNDYNPAEVPDGVSFTTNITPIFETGCTNAGCHNGAIKPDLRSDVAYKSLIKGGYVTDVTVAENNSLYQKINDGGSMKAYATDLDRAYIKKWIEEGALDN